MADIADILGNDRMKEHFITALVHEKVSHAYIIEGEKGSGKKMLASAFSKILQCEERKEGTSACGLCESCIQIEQKDHPDVIWVTHEKPASIRVNEIREQVINSVDIKPYKGPYKIYIIDEAEKMQPEAQNAILKTIEEPPEYVVIFMLSTNRGAFLDTILSRCVFLSTNPVPEKEVAKYLINKYQIPSEEAEFCAGFSMGNVGKAVLISTSEEFRNLKDITLSILRYIDEIEVYEITEKVKEYKKYKNSISNFFDIFYMWFRDLLLLKSCDGRRNPMDQLIFKKEYMYLRKQADCISMESVDYILNRIRRAERRIRAYVNFEATIELLILEAGNEFKNK
ncbi:MAG: DNA polymerase III subunit delta [Eubacterium sp.]|nr:DNA polymerase III subunit delta [Eubacterium sp.]MDD7209964.1 DNA polymerase III subunit delta [Lachnospiraceae bacterium]MDY5497869.1 DNA polymerase III subunit delta [Anaerobutyricum sp.]